MLAVVCPKCNSEFPLLDCCKNVEDKQATSTISNTVSISTKCSMQSGGCIIKCADGAPEENLINSSAVDLGHRPNFMSSGGCIIQKNELPSECTQEVQTDNSSSGVGCNSSNRCCYSANELCQRSLCQVAPGQHLQCRARHDAPKQCQWFLTDSVDKSSKQSNGSQTTKCLGDVEIQVQTTVKLPSNNMGCTVNITTTTTTQPSTRVPNHFNGGGIISSLEEQEVDQRASTSPVSWVIHYPWNLNISQDFAHLNEVRKTLQICGWYHESLSWQQSESLLKDCQEGKWLFRNSSDARYAFAISVKLKTGPTSVRVLYFMGQFRLDSLPMLSQSMPLFDHPIKMIEYYKKNVEQKEVWVDHSRQHYSKIYLDEPLLKEVRPLYHLARLAVNKNKLPTQHLPQMIKNYLSEYPYTL